ncbi:hypothetical protein L2E82_10801 [Cichorium intybus]|uniref:Uncharacterized protein n=1 Tax=Cichorium intybus TaxID=13427 RepID=A0ACB9GBK9_CICIN|nr:hypothetical protein L2E82_10801 [Cichorium intybus]
MFANLILNKSPFFPLIRKFPPSPHLSLPPPHEIQREIPQTKNWGSDLILHLSLTSNRVNKTLNSISISVFGAGLVII